MLIRIPNINQGQHEVVLSVAADAEVPPEDSLRLGVAWLMFMPLVLLPCMAYVAYLAALYGNDAAFLAVQLVVMVLSGLCMYTSNLGGNSRAKREIAKLKEGSHVLDLSHGSEDRHLMMQVPRFANLTPTGTLPESFSRLDEHVARAILLNDPSARQACVILAKNSTLAGGSGDGQLTLVAIADLRAQIQTVDDRACQEFLLDDDGLNKEAFGNTGLDPYRKNSEE